MEQVAKGRGVVVGFATTEAQQEELTVLDSIYADAFVQHTTTPCEASPTHPYQVSIQVAPEGHCTTEPEGVCSFPPLLLHFGYSPDYPAHSPPSFTLRAPWLQSHTSVHREPYQLLCDAMVQLFRENQGDVVMFTWVEWYGLMLPNTTLDLPHHNTNKHTLKLTIAVVEG
eukprot:TRINITY_DN2878_c0_g1_i2.p2 TRINITY_DN2878_c0_g1~~TRINITY_DN2878_c0_g1_i2.p2  ORF type:complete len:170 (-),score=18.78 TRINITY_DN2878_c0_g1_i2:655-1164(-)